MQADWTFMTSGLDAGTVKRGVTSGVARPNGGGNFVFGFNSLSAATGAVSLYSAQSNFAPMAKGGSVRGAVQRGPGGGPTNFSPFLYICASTNDVSGTAYLLGLDDDDPHSIVLVKGQIQGGVPSVSPGTLGVLAKGTESFQNGTWLHLRLDAIVNPNGDVILNCFRNDLTANPVTAPVWSPVAGIGSAGVYVDDALGVNTGTAPLTSGYCGFGFVTKDVTRRSYFDQLEVQRQL